MVSASSPKSENIMHPAAKENAKLYWPNPQSSRCLASIIKKKAPRSFVVRLLATRKSVFLNTRDAEPMLADNRFGYISVGDRAYIILIR